VKWVILKVYDAISEIRICESKCIYSKNNPAKFHSNLIRNNGALGIFLKSAGPNKNKNNKMSGNICISVLLNASDMSHDWPRKLALQVGCKFVQNNCISQCWKSSAYAHTFPVKVRSGSGKTFLANTIIHVLTGWVVCRCESPAASFSESSFADTLGVESHDVLSVLTVYSHSDVAIYRQQHSIRRIIHQWDDNAKLQHRSNKNKKDNEITET